MKYLHLFALIFLILGGCQSADESASTDQNIFTDDLERRVAAPDTVRRIVSLAPSMTEMVFAAGAGNHIVGVSDADDHPDLADSVTTFSALPIDFETVTALQPDLIVGTDQINSPNDAEKLQQLNFPTVYFSFESIGDIPRVIKRIGTLVDREEYARQAADSLTAQLSEFRRQTDTLDQRPRVLFLIGADPLYAFGGDSYVNEMIALAGGNSVTDSLSEASPVLSEEFVLESRPDIIIGTFGHNYKSEQLLELHPTWRHLPAIQTEEVHSIPKNWVLRPTPNVIHGIRHMMARLHPSLIDSSHVGTESS